MASNEKKTTKRKKKKLRTWNDAIRIALERLGGEAHLSELNPVVAEVRAEQGMDLSATWKATVRRELQFGERFVQDVPKSGVWQLTSPEEGDEADDFAA
jgi:hypothetical protein